MTDNAVGNNDNEISEKKDSEKQRKKHTCEKISASIYINQYVCVFVCVCLFAYNLGTRQVIVSKFSG